ncbi:MAG: hypothetical protein ACFFEA_11735 [Candidatus Thorarchaeota archaeon]
MKRLVLLAIAVLLLASIPTSPTSHHTMSSTGSSKAIAAESLGGISENEGSLLFTEQFQSPPLGYNSSEWNLIEINDPSLAWNDGESLDLWGEQFKTVLLRSTRDFSPGIIAELNASFTQGTCYSCLGWCDEWHDVENDWIANARLCQNGVFIDCWDGELFLVAYADGERTVASIDTGGLTGWHILRIEWTESIVRLEIDATLVAFVSRTIPQSPLTMSLLVSGHHSQVEPGRLSLESLDIYEFDRESRSIDPEIVLLRPENNSIVYPLDILDFEVRGAATNMSCSWEKGPSFKVDSPWDIEVPCIIYGDPFTLPASLRLTLKATSAEGHESTVVYTFRIDERECEFGVWVMQTQPVVDGSVDENEAAHASRFEVGFRSECGEEVRVNLLAGYTSDSLYVAIESPIPDSYHSRAILFLDANADGLWSIQTPDLGVSHASPSADSTYTSVFGMNDSLIPNLVSAASDTDNVVVYEFLIPLSDLNVDTREGIAIGLQLVHGGYNLDFPDKYGLSLMYSLGVSAPNPNTWQFVLLGAVLLLTGGSYAVLIYKSRKDTYYHEHEPYDDSIQRIKILLLSYDRLALSRLSRMMNMESQAVETIVEDLIASGFPVYRANNEFVRLCKSSGNNESKVL